MSVDASAPAPNHLRLVAAGAVTLGIAALVSILNAAQFPHDGKYYLLLRLMWQGNEDWIPVVLAVFGLLQALLVLWGITLLVVGVKRKGIEPLRRLVQQLWPYAPAFPIYYFSATSLGRVVANSLYALQGNSAFQLTPLLANLEGRLLLALQSSLSVPVFGYAAAAVYSYVWFGGLLAAVPGFVFARDADTALDAALGPALLSLLALPVYVLFPVFDPWTLNSAYGPVSGPSLAVYYSYPAAAPELLRRVLVEAPGVVGSCLPSLHVAIPAYFAILANRRGHRRIAWLFAAVTVFVTIAVSWLGRHWIVDGIVAIPFAWLCVLIIDRLRHHIQNGLRFRHQ